MNEAKGKLNKGSNGLKIALISVVCFIASAAGWYFWPRGTNQARMIFKNTSITGWNARSKMRERPNGLIHEKSPYLLRHAYDPVDWRPWGEEAFRKARESNKPIFLSIGYASCFACYSMQREVFEDKKIAAQMNKFAINILVDREERPDIDRLYMAAIRTISGSGGWPMSLFLTPERKPFFGATYLTAAVFSMTLERVHDVWQRHPEKLTGSGDFISTYLLGASEREAKQPLVAKNSLRKGFDAFHALYDAQFGGFGSAPKFPRPMILNFLLRYYARTGDRSALNMTVKTLQEMEAGALFDHLGYGFHRYSADDQWRTPHFEKMIYDQALLAIAYLEAYQLTKDSQFSLTARNTLTFVQREMTSPEGAFYGAVDAASSHDSSSSQEKIPGAFYTWTSAEIDRVVGLQDAPLIHYLFGIRPEGNSLIDPLNIAGNQNVIFASHTEKEAASSFRRTESEVHSIVEKDVQKLIEARQHRPRPAIDDKIILSWNALMISAFAKASEVLNDPGYLKTAERCNQFLDQKLSTPDRHQLLRRYRNGESRFEANLQDHAFYIQALLDLYEASFDIRYLKSAVAFTEQMLLRFEDEKNGGFFDTQADDKSLLVRTREFYDDSEPSGNSIAVLDLLRLAQMTDNRRFKEKADRAVQFFSSRLADQPETMPQFLSAMEFALQKPKQIIVAGRADDPSTHRILKEIRSRFLPDTIVLLADGKEGQKTLSEFLPVMSSIRMVGGLPTAYVCENYVCKLPTSDPVSLARILDRKN